MAPKQKVIVPASQGYIDFGEFFKKAQVLSLYDVNKSLNEFSDVELQSWLQKCFECLFDELFDVYKRTTKDKKATRFNGDFITYTFDHYECFLRIYLHKGSVSYSVRVNTINANSRLDCCWYFNELPFHETGIFVSALNDFSELMNLCQSLSYAFEYNDVAVFEFIPRGTYKSNGSWFCSLAEDKILTERHYYQGYIDYDHDRCKVSFNWDEFLEKCKVS